MAIEYSYPRRQDLVARKAKSANDTMSDDEYEIPLRDQRVFGAGIKRKRVKFVSSSSAASTTTTSPSKSSAQDVASRYLSLVLPSDTAPSMTASTTFENASTCEICKLPLTTNNPDATTSHDTTLAHQVCLPHSHPPSYLDRNRKGLSILSAYGWDPDSRLGLGSAGQGIQFPVKVKEKSDKLGVGVVVPSDVEMRKRAEQRAKGKEERRKLDAGRVRKKTVEEGRKRERLQREFYGSHETERYLEKRTEWE